ncbi:TraR/DksA C4-type zinc finger protein [Vreelandella rituensis]|nr:TraR/DksA C4-type zinc finger protein [Halomonas rituensis]
MADEGEIANILADRTVAESIAQNAKLLSKQANKPECEDCGLEIPQQRREIAPWAETCTECQSIREQRGKHRRVAY